jgi:uncharacterized protein
MKYLVIFVLLLVVFGLWRSKKNAAAAARSVPKVRITDVPATEVISCAFCEVHLPRAEALAGKKGHYCSLAHRLKAGDG